MKREPSIHITRSQFLEICKELGIDVSVDTFFAYARKKGILSRGVIVSNKKEQKKVNTLLLATTGDANLVADIIYATRIKLKHRGVRKINQTNTREWAGCKKLAEICNTFCQDFNLPTREGFIKYIEIGISRMKDARNLVNRLIGMQENITEDYDAQLQLSQLSRSELEQIKEIKDYFYKSIADATGIYERDEKADKLIHFLKLKELLDENNWDYRIYIDAQFESLAWCNGIPNIRDLYEDRSIERFNKYLYRIHGRKVQNQEKEESLWKQISKGDE